jgi:Mn-dependent DtxR family transcriptional regulator
VTEFYIEIESRYWDTYLGSIGQWKELQMRDIELGDLPELRKRRASIAQAFASLARRRLVGKDVTGLIGLTEEGKQEYRRLMEKDNP